MRLSSFILAGTILLSCISCGNNRSEETVMKEGNPVIENIMARRSIRKYKAEPVSRATMDTILMCGINAPNGMNRQSWEVRVVDKPEVMAEIKEYMKAANPDVKPEMIEGCFRGAPTMVFVANDPAYDFSAIDCGLLSENIMLSAWSLGVGSVCLGSPVRFLMNSPEAMDRLGFSEGYTPIICIGLGYPDESPEAKPRDAGKVRFVD
jgi:nitroreductase